MSFLDWLWGKKSEDNGFAPHVSPVLPPSMPQLHVAVAPPPPAPPAAPAPSSYTVESAIELMRTLPFDDDPELVLRVVRKTLRSTGVSVEEIIASAGNRESALSASAAKERAAIEQLENEIAARRTSIGRIETQLEETRTVRSRLEDAIDEETKVQNSLPPEEIMRLQSEAEAARRAPSPALPVPSFPPVAEAKAEIPPAPRSQSPAVLKPSMPPLPKVAPPPASKKSLPPKIPATPRKSTKADVPPTSSASSAATEASSDTSAMRLGGAAMEDGAVTKD